MRLVVEGEALAVGAEQVLRVSDRRALARVGPDREVKPVLPREGGEPAGGRAVRRLGQRGEAVSLLNLALQHINQLPALRPDLPAEDDAQLSSLCQFDMLACLAAAADEDAGYLYPNFAPFFAERSDPAVLAILDDDDLRQQVFPAPDDELAEALREIGRIARAQAGPFAGWHGYEDPRIQRVLIEHPARDA